MLPYYFSDTKHLCSIIFYRFCTGFAPALHRFFTGFSAKIEKNLPIFCNFFSLCINDLRKS